MERSDAFVRLCTTRVPGEELQLTHLRRDERADRLADTQRELLRQRTAATRLDTATSAAELSTAATPNPTRTAAARRRRRNGSTAGGIVRAP